MLEQDLLRSGSLSQYKTQLFQMQMALNAAPGRLSEEGFRGLLRAFGWFSHQPMFQDLYDACRAAMPVLGGYLIHAASQGDAGPGSSTLARVNRLAEVLSDYLDQAALSLAEDEESGFIVAMACYPLEEELGRASGDLLAASDVVVEKERQLHEGAGPGLQEVLKRTPLERIRHLKEKFSEVTACKNCAYNILRVVGKKVIPLIEAHIDTLHPTDQDYLLHALDAFPSNKAVLAFYGRFLEQTPYESLKARVEKYSSRVRDGVKTTGWET